MYDSIDDLYFITLILAIFVVYNHFFLILQSLSKKHLIFVYCICSIQIIVPNLSILLILKELFNVYYIFAGNLGYKILLKSLTTEKNDKI